MSAANSHGHFVMHHFKDSDNRNHDYPDDQSAINELNRIIIRLGELGWKNPNSVGLQDGDYEAIYFCNPEISTCCRYIRNGEVVYRTIKEGTMYFGKPFRVRKI